MAPSKGKQTSFLGRVDRWQAKDHSDEMPSWSTSLPFAIEHCVVIYATESRIKLLDTANTKAYDIEWPDRRESVDLSSSSKSSYRAVVREFSAEDQLFYDCGKYKLQAIDETSKVHEKFIKAVIEYAETQGQNVK